MAESIWEVVGPQLLRVTAVVKASSAEEARKLFDEGKYYETAFKVLTNPPAKPMAELAEFLLQEPSCKPMEALPELTEVQRKLFDDCLEQHNYHEETTLLDVVAGFKEMEPDELAECMDVPGFTYADVPQLRQEIQAMADKYGENCKLHWLYPSTYKRYFGGEET